MVLPAAGRRHRARVPLAGLPPGPDLDHYAVAAITGTTARQAGRALDELARACLVQPTRLGQYGVHDLLRSYARELAAESTAEDGRAALTRLFDYYLHTASEAVNTLFPATQYRRPKIAAPDTPVPVIKSEAAARAWLDTQRPSLAAAAVRATENGWPGHATRLSATLFDYLVSGAHYPEAITVHSSACQAARITGDRGAEAGALNSLSAVDYFLGRYQQAVSHLTEAAAAFQEAGDHAGRARALSNLGFVEFHEGHCQEAVRRLEESLAVLRETDDQQGLASVLANLGFTALRQGRYRQANDYLHEALALFREAGNRNGVTHALSNLGEAALRQGRYQQVTSHLVKALALCQRLATAPMRPTH